MITNEASQSWMYGRGSSALAGLALLVGRRARVAGTGARRSLCGLMVGGKAKSDRKGGHRAFRKILARANLRKKGWTTP